ncbi:hypothetical protein EfmJHP80_28000 [Enterococcus faecium]|nr:hypothetical protein EfmJHP80_28000 [Enterococcus faecium]
MDFNKKFFWEISDLSCFVESERLSNGNNSVLNEYDKVVINKVKVYVKKLENLSVILMVAILNKHYLI